ncbi:MAG: division/cell wall cluster transcriptional repressor MraZ [Anaerolineaceae bacterium]
MFLGQYEHTIDEKGRLTIPSRYRDLLAGGATLTQGLDQNIMVLTTDVFSRMAAQATAMNLTDPNARLLNRLIFSNAEQVEVDRAGRILIPSFLRQAAMLDTNVRIVGAGEYFEIWSPDGWAKQQIRMQDTDANAQRFSGLQLTTV